jgi:O-antigen/teichoic acid export membrane protein
MRFGPGTLAVLRRHGVDQPVLFSLLARGVQSAGAAVSIVLVARYLSISTQGYYYTILGFVAFVQLADFGLAYAVMQSASHEAQRASNTDGGNSNKPEAASERLHALLKGATRFNVAASAFAIVIIALVGTAVLNANPVAAQELQFDWRGPWFVALLFAGANQLLTPLVSVLEGSGYTAEVWRLRLEQEIVAAVCLWVALVVGAGLWSVALAWAARFLVGSVWVSRSRAWLGYRPKSEVSTTSYWLQEVWPFQWRVGLSYLAGFLIFQAITPIIFSVRGPVAAAQFGMTMAIVNGLLSVSTAWLNSRAPAFGKLIADRSYERLDREFATALKSSLLLVTFLGFVVIGLLAFLQSIGSSFAARLLPLFPFATLAASAVVNHFITGLAVYLRAHRREPLLWSSLFGAVLTPFTIYMTGRYGSIEWIAASYLMLALLGAGIAVAVYQACVKQWRPVRLVTSASNDADA